LKVPRIKVEGIQQNRVFPGGTVEEVIISFEYLTINYVLRVQPEGYVFIGTFSPNNLAGGIEKPQYRVGTGTPPN